MKLKDLYKKNIFILGLGIENYWLVKFLLKEKIDCQIYICDARSSKVLGEKYVELSKKKNIFWQLGIEYKDNLFIGNILFRSPGWPLNCPGVKEAKKQGSIIYSPMKLFFDICPAKNIIGVTGTKGKGTTSSLIYSIFKAAKKDVYLGGNIGVAPFSFLNKLKKDSCVVLELSSFQLEDLNKSPHICVITNFYSEHLAPADPNNPNFHKSLSAYWKAKANIFIHQNDNDWLVAGQQIEKRVLHELKITKAKSQVIFYDKSGFPSLLPGDHNRENIAAAVQVAELLAIKENIIRKAVSSFKGLEHRLELVREFVGVKYYDDSFATTPEATIIAMKAISAQKIMLLGGAEKNADFSQLARIAKKSVKFVVLLSGVATPRIKKELLAVGFKNNQMKLVHNIVEAVKVAKDKAVAGDAVILSTACASFGMFNNYKERGNLFKIEVNKIK